MQSTDAIFNEVRRLVALLDAEERLALIRHIVTAPFTAPTDRSQADSAPRPETHRPERANERQERMRDEQTRWYARSEDERSQYAGSYVALHNKDVVDHDVDRRALYLRIRERFGNEPIPIIPAEQSSLPEYVIRSPKLVR